MKVKLKLILSNFLQYSIHIKTPKDHPFLDRVSTHASPDQQNTTHCLRTHQILTSLKPIHPKTLTHKLTPPQSLTHPNT